MSRKPPSLPLVEVAVGLVWHKNKLFIARRGGSGHLPGMWEFPGGKRRSRESFAACVARECREEMGGDVDVGAERCVLEYDYADRRVVIHVLDCCWSGEEPAVNGKREWRWAAPDRLKRFKFPPANRRLIDDLVARSRQLKSGLQTPAPDTPAGWPPGRPNRLNELSAREWLLFQKSWFIHNPPPREKGVVVHPAKFPESLVEGFIRFFTKRGQIVLDPMVGTGSTLLAAHAAGRRGIGVELNPRYARIARERLLKVGASVPSSIVHRTSSISQVVIAGDALKLNEYRLPPVDYCITSPPYWDMLRAGGAETQRRRRAASDLDVHYSDDPADVGNLEDYEAFLRSLFQLFEQVYRVLKPGGYVTVIVKNVKKGGKVYALAWDLGRRLSHLYTMKDEKIWLQDNQRLAPYGLGYAWVSNTFHHYCLNFRKE